MYACSAARAAALDADQPVDATEEARNAHVQIAQDIAELVYDALPPAPIFDKFTQLREATYAEGKGA